MTIVFYDIENIARAKGKKSAVHNLEAVYQSIVSFPEVGKIVEHRAYYGRATVGEQVKGLLKRLHILSVETEKPKIRPHGQYKNFTDLHIFTDALHVAYTNPEVECFVLASYDCDFFVLAGRLHQLGKMVIVFDKESLEPTLFLSPKKKVKQDLNAVRQVNRVLKAVAQKYSGILDFEELVCRMITKSMEDDTFRAVLQGSGINISGIYQHIKLTPRKKALTYKQGGQKKMPPAFAKALLGSKFCVVERGGLFFVMEKELVPEGGVLVFPQIEDHSASAAINYGAWI